LKKSPLLTGLCRKRDLSKDKKGIGLRGKASATIMPEGGKEKKKKRGKKGGGLRG